MASALRQAGLRRGDVVFSHSNIGYFGYPEEGRTATDAFQTILGAFHDVIGDEGTLVVPTFTYSFARREAFDPDSTASAMGTFAEMLRLHPKSSRSHDPLFSVAALGARAQELTANMPRECFGKDSFWDRFLETDGVVCNLNLDAGSTFIHYVERCLNVPYRYDKVFPGVFVINGQTISGDAVYFCADTSNPDLEAKFENFDAVARSQGVVRNVRVGRGAIVAIKAADVFRVIKDGLRHDPWLLTACGRVGGKAPMLLRSIDRSDFGVSLSENAPIEEISKSLWHVPGGLMSNGYDAALDALSHQVAMRVHEYPTGTHCREWIVPEKWVCREACLETLDGRRIFSLVDNALHVPEYSQPFSGTVTREELLKHLTVDLSNRRAIPYHQMLSERDWGLCCSQETKESLIETDYRVHISANFTYGTLKIGEVTVPGEHADTIILCAHLGYPPQGHGGLIGAAVGIGVMRELLKRDQLLYTYRLLIVPDPIGSFAYLSQNEQVVPKTKGGLFLDGLGLPGPYILQLSNHGRTEMDLCFGLAMRAHDPTGRATIPSPGIDCAWSQFGAQSELIPVLSFSHALQSSMDAPDPKGSTSHSGNDLRMVSAEHLQRSVDLVLHMIDVLENNLIPVPVLRGELLLEREDVRSELSSSPERSQKLGEIVLAMDGTRTLAQIADAHAMSFETARQIAEKLNQRGLLEYRNLP